MKVTPSELRNLRALEWLEQEGNHFPTQKEINKTEKLLKEMEEEFKLWIEVITSKRALKNNCLVD